MTSSAARIPVIVGVGQVNDRPAQPDQGLDSIGLMAEAARAAERDAGVPLLARCDWVAIVPQMSFAALDPVALLPAALGIAPKRIAQAPSPSGDTPIRHL